VARQGAIGERPIPKSLRLSCRVGSYLVGDPASLIGDLERARSDVDHHIGYRAQHMLAGPAAAIFLGVQLADLRGVPDDVPEGPPVCVAVVVGYGDDLPSAGLPLVR